MMRPVLPSHGTYFGLCNQLGFIFQGLQEAKENKKTSVKIGVFNTDIAKPDYIPTNELFDFSEIENQNNILITYEDKIPKKYETNYKMQFNFNKEYCEMFKFSRKIESFSDEIIKNLPPIVAVVHSKLEKDVFLLRKEHGGNIEEYEKDMIDQYTEVLKKIPEGNILLLTHDIHSFWKQKNNVIIPPKKSECREISAAIEMSLAIKLLKDSKIHWVKVSGSTFDFVMQYKIQGNPQHIINS